MKKVFINSLPKAGTNLLAKAFDLIDYKQIGHIGSNINFKNKISNFFFNRFTLMNSNTYLCGIDSPRFHNKYYLNKKINRAISGQYITAHVGYEDDILSYILKKDFKCFLVLRDPRAVIASSVKFISKNNNHPFHLALRKMSNEERYEKILTGFCYRNIVYKSMIDRCKSIEPWINNKNVLKIKFEDLIGPKGGGEFENMRTTLASIFDFINFPSSNLNDISDNLFGPGRSTFRKGNIDSWKEEIPFRIQKHINSDMNFLLKQWGYK